MSALFSIIAKPDNLPIALMLVIFIALLALWWRVARRNDRLLSDGGEELVLEHMEGPAPAPTEAGQPGSRLHSWPYLVRIELLVALAVLLVLTVWSILLDAPLEQMADPTRTPNPSKAPWYFLGLQEMLVYFDPWIAGVALPLLIIFGLCAIPYLDVNRQASGYYCWRQRRFAISTFLFGFGVLWIALIIIGVFCRGPGWTWFWPWQTWQRWSTVQIRTVNWSDFIGIRSRAGGMLFGGLSVAAYYSLGIVFWFARRHSPTIRRLGPARYAIVAVLFLTMLGLPIKMVLRLALSIKYVWVTPWFNI